MHGVNAVAWDAGLAAKAQAWADASAGGERSDSGSPHDPTLNTESGKYNGQYMGENMSFRPSAGQNIQSVKAWYSEETACSTWPGCKPGTDGKVTGHFTAMVWKGVTKMGCAQSKSKGTYSGNSYYFYVCRYWPAPNMRGQYKENVFSKSKTEASCE